MCTESASRRVSRIVLTMLAYLFASAGVAAVPVHVVKTDLKPAIRAGMQSPVQFAVLVPHRVSTASGGAWSTSNGQATWSYAVQVPSAVSLSFYAKAVLPAAATLVVRGAKTTTSYRARDLHRGELWSRIQPGAGLQLLLTVPADQRGHVVFNLVSLQAGYRSIGPGVEDHPYYRQLKTQAAEATGNASCVTNYKCKVTAANTPAGAATVGLIIGNLYQCTGTLLNDVPEDNTPYILTARHCQTGQAGGGNPGAAADVSVYWDATTACGSALGSLYDPGIPTQTGAQTIVEQQDAWLIELDANPVVSDAQLAGFDASGGAVQGGYTIHHAEGGNKQFTAWFGQAAAVQDTGVLGTAYVSNFWETVNQIGNVGPGASGSGLFDQNNHLVGSDTLGRTTSDPSGYGSCPVASPPAPNGSNGVADFTALAAVWDSTADTTSSTGNTTLKTVLDPGNTGTTVVSSMPVAPISLTASAESASIQTSVTLTWAAATATQCTAGGGVAGDAWSGTLAASGSKAVTETAANLVTYTITCTYPGGRSARSSFTVSWLGPSPVLQFSAPSQMWINAPATLSWNSNVAPCAIAGGGLALSNLPASGTTTTTQPAAGVVGYNLTCGPPNQQGSYPVSVLYVIPSLEFDANGTDRLLGVTFFLTWTTAAASCTPSGGAPGDGWANTAFPGVYSDAPVSFSPNVTALGTYTYTLACSGGPNTVQKSVTVTFENNPPYVDLSITPSTVIFTDSPADFATVSWKTNLASCGLGSTPNLPLGIDSNPYLSDGDQIATPQSSGTYQITINCYPTLGTGPQAASATATLTVLPPPPPVINLSFNTSTVVAGESFIASWTASNSNDCELTGGIPGQEWGASPGFGFGATGDFDLKGQAGSYTFGVTCRSIDPNVANASAQAMLNVGTLSATLTSSATSVASGASFTLTWTSVDAAACAARDGGANGTKWSGSIGTSGSATQTADTVGTWTYTIDCTQGDVTASSSVKIDVTAAASSGSGSGSGGGGGGAIGLLELSLLGAWQVLRRRRSAVPAERRSAA